MILIDHLFLKRSENSQQQIHEKMLIFFSPQGMANKNYIEISLSQNGYSLKTKK
jgi:hypothetical protein